MEDFTQSVLTEQEAAKMKALEAPQQEYLNKKPFTFFVRNTQLKHTLHSLQEVAFLVLMVFIIFGLSLTTLIVKSIIGLAALCCAFNLFVVRKDDPRKLPTQK